MRPAASPVFLFRRTVTITIQASRCCLSGHGSGTIPYRVPVATTSPSVSLSRSMLSAVSSKTNTRLLGTRLNTRHRRRITVCRGLAANSSLPSLSGLGDIAPPAAGAATLAAAAAVASVAASGLWRTQALSAQLSTAASATSTAVAPTAPASTTASHVNHSAAATASSSSLPASSSPASPASGSASSACLEGSPVPWATLGPCLELIQQRFRVGPATFRLVAPGDVDAVMDMYLDKGLLDSDPYWTRAWPSAIALAGTLLQRPELVRGKVVADLGAGLGLAGMAAAMAGAREVVLLDREPLALQCALLSAAATGLDSDPDCAAAAAGSSGRHQIEPLPADQAPAYGTVQLTPPYRQRYSGQQRQLSQPAAAADAGASGGSGGGGSPEEQDMYGTHAIDTSRPAAPPATEAEKEAEWEALLELARGLRHGNCSSSTPAEAHSPAVPTTGHGAAGGPAGCMYRAHVFDWTAPPEMDRLLPPVSAPGRGPAPSSTPQRGPRRQRRFDVVLACDVLYEDAAVGPIAGLMPLLLEPAGGRLLLADPPNRTVRNRERFLEELKSGPLRLAVEECSLQECEVSKLDNEMAGGLAPTAETVPVQFLVFRSCVGNDTVGVKL